MYIDRQQRLFAQDSSIIIVHHNKVDSAIRKYKKIANRHLLLIRNRNKFPKPSERTRFKRKLAARRAKKHMNAR